MKLAWTLPLLLAAGCSLAPPRPLEEDPETSALGQALAPEVAERWIPPTLAVAPVDLAYARERTTREDTWTRPPLDPERLQRRVARLIGWSLDAWRATPREDWPLVLGRDLAPSSEAEAARVAADDAGASLVLRLEVTRNQVTFAGRDGLWWWGDLLLVWGFGVLPAVFIPDELYALDLTVRWTVEHARSGRELLQGEHTARVRESFNDFQRGYSVASILFLHEALLEPGEEDFGQVYEALLPHALKQVERRLLEDLRARLPREVEEHRDLLRKGAPGAARTYALVLASSNPNLPSWRGTSDPPLPLKAGDDAEAMVEALAESDVVRRKDLSRCTVIDVPNPQERLKSALAWLGPRVLEDDRLIVYFAGYGTTDEEARPALVLDDGILTLQDLRAACRASLTHTPSVLFLLDTSFSNRDEDFGRSYRWEVEEPGGPSPGPDYLDALGDPQLGWTVLAAAGPDEVACELREEPRHGAFTWRVLQALGGASDGADAAPDGRVTTGWLWTYVRSRVNGDLAADGQAGRTQTATLRPEGARDVLVAEGARPPR